jgi:CRP-like cAMP-binding protein
VLDKHRTEQMVAGEFFGEIAALSRMARTSTIFADSDDAELLEIRWQGLRDLMKYDDALRTHINKIYRERALASYLRATPLFEHWSRSSLDKVAEAVEFSTYGDYDWSGEYKRLAQSGSVRPEREPVIVGEGDHPERHRAAARRLRAREPENSAAANARSITSARGRFSD